jgi:Ser/Thr protein kinase RdoA (MazF antagonist)
MLSGDLEARLEALAERALEAWAFDGSKLTLVSASENTVYRVDTDTGRSYALRIHRPGYHTFQELESEQRWTAALSEAGIAAPAPVPTCDGKRYATVQLPDASESRHVGVVEWIDGVPLARIIDEATNDELVAQRFEQLGVIAAKIHNQAAEWRVPDGFRRHAFDVEGLMGSTPFWGPFWELPQLKPGERRRILRARGAIRATLLDYGKEPTTFSLIHADLHPHNVMVDGERLYVIDFDDAGFGWHQYELAVALFYYKGEKNFDVMRAALIAGYRSERDLTDTALELLPMFLLIRALVLLGWIHGRPELDRTDVLRRLIRRACSEIEELGL